MKQKYQKRKKAKKSVRLDARVSLYKNKKEYTFLVSRLIASAWCNGYSPGLTVNHIDGNPQNNNASNLEWVTRKENIQKGFENGIYTRPKKCFLLDENGKEMQFSSMASASKYLGRNPKYITYRVAKMKVTATNRAGEKFDIRMGQ